MDTTAEEIRNIPDVDIKDLERVMLRTVEKKTNPTDAVQELQPVVIKFASRLPGVKPYNFANICIIVGDTSHGKDTTAAHIAGMPELAFNDNKTDIGTKCPEQITVHKIPELEENAFKITAILVNGEQVEEKNVYPAEGSEYGNDLKAMLAARKKFQNDLPKVGVDNTIRIELKVRSDNVKSSIITFYNFPGFITSEALGGKELNEAINRRISDMNSTGHGTIYIVRNVVNPVKNENWQNLDIIKEAQKGKKPNIPIVFVHTFGDMLVVSDTLNTYDQVYKEIYGQVDAVLPGAKHFTITNWDSRKQEIKEGDLGKAESEKLSQTIQEIDDQCAKDKNMNARGRLLNTFHMKNLRAHFQSTFIVRSKDPFRKLLNLIRTMLQTLINDIDQYKGHFGEDNVSYGIALWHVATEIAASGRKVFLDPIGAANENTLSVSDDDFVEKHGLTAEQEFVDCKIFASAMGLDLPELDEGKGHTSWIATITENRNRPNMSKNETDSMDQNKTKHFVHQVLWDRFFANILTHVGKTAKARPVSKHILAYVSCSPGGMSQTIANAIILASLKEVKAVLDKYATFISIYLAFQTAKTMKMLAHLIINSESEESLDKGYEVLRNEFVKTKVIDETIERVYGKKFQEYLEESFKRLNYGVLRIKPEDQKSAKLSDVDLKGLDVIQNYVNEVFRKKLTDIIQHARDFLCEEAAAKWNLWSPTPKPDAFLWVFKQFLFTIVPTEKTYKAAIKAAINRRPRLKSFLTSSESIPKQFRPNLGYHHASGHVTAAPIFERKLVKDLYLTGLIEDFDQSKPWISESFFLPLDQGAMEFAKELLTQEIEAKLDTDDNKPLYLRILKDDAKMCKKLVDVLNLSKRFNGHVFKENLLSPDSDLSPRVEMAMETVACIVLNNKSLEDRGEEDGGEEDRGEDGGEDVKQSK